METTRISRGACRASLLPNGFRGYATVTGTRRCSVNWDRIKTAGGKFKYGIDLLPRDVELLDDFFYGGAGFKVSNTADTGIRLLRNTHAPFSLPGTLSTAGHWDQSRVVMSYLLPS